MKAARAPKERGYTAYVKSEATRVSKDMCSLTGLSAGKSKKVGGRAVYDTLRAYIAMANNTTGECWPSARALGEDAGRDERTIRAAQKHLIEWGWLHELAPATPGHRGVHVRVEVGRLPDSDNEEDNAQRDDLMEDIDCMDRTHAGRNNVRPPTAAQDDVWARAYERHLADGKELMESQKRDREAILSRIAARQNAPTFE